MLGESGLREREGGECVREKDREQSVLSGRLKESGEEIRKWNERTGELDKRVGWGEREGIVHK